MCHGVNVKGHDEAVFDYVLGCNITYFALIFTQLAFANELTPDVMTKVGELLFRRSPEIRSRIDNTD